MLIHHITRAKLKLLTSGPLKTKKFPASRKMFELLNQMWGISTCCYLNGFLQTTKGRTINTHIMLQIRKKKGMDHIQFPPGNYIYMSFPALEITASILQDLFTAKSAKRCTSLLTKQKQGYSANLLVVNHIQLLL